VGGAVQQMQAVLADLQRWLSLVEKGKSPEMPPEQVAAAIVALEAGIAALTGEGLAEESGATEMTLTLVDTDQLIAQIQEFVMKRGVALPADVIALVLEAEDEVLYSHNAEPDEEEGED